MKEVAPGASLTDGKRTTRLFLTDSETGNASEKQGGSPSKKEAGLIRPFSFVSFSFIFSLNFLFRLPFKLLSQQTHIPAHLQILDLSIVLSRLEIHVT